MDKSILEQIAGLYDIDSGTLEPVPGHENGRNLVYYCPKGVLRVSELGDRTYEQYLAETEFVEYLAENGAPVAGVIRSPRGEPVERIEADGGTVYACMFQRAKGILLAENGYRYREGAPLSEYFFNTGRALGKIHRLSKEYRPKHRRPGYFEKYNMEYIDRLLGDGYAPLREAVAKRLEAFRSLPADSESYGLVHFDFSDGNYHVDMETGEITAFDFDNCMECWYMFDLANLWVHGWGWCMNHGDPERRREIMDGYFGDILGGYRAETTVSGELLDKLPLFIDMVLIENIADEFECAAREGGSVDPEDIEDAAHCLTKNIAYAGFFEE